MRNKIIGTIIVYGSVAIFFLVIVAISNPENIKNNIATSGVALLAVCLLVLGVMYGTKIYKK